MEVAIARGIELSPILSAPAVYALSVSDCVLRLLNLCRLKWRRNLGSLDSLDDSQESQCNVQPLSDIDSLLGKDI